MRSIGITNKYEYLPGYNTIINKETKKILPDIFKEKKVRIKEVIVTSELIRNELKRISQLTFEVTQDCNLRCKYCINSEHYFFERKISKNYLELEVARKGLEFFFNEIKRRTDKSLTIGFFGGEPLLAFEVIKKIVDYSKELFVGWNLRYTITTNGTIINSEMINFFIQNSFSIYISLDGPQDIHNAKRVYANGKGSFKKVWENLLKIREFNNRYFKEKVHFNMVYSKDLPIIDRINFFNETPLLKNSFVTSSFVNYLSSDYYQKHSFDSDKYFEELDSVLEKIKIKLINREKLKSSELFFEKLIKIGNLNVKDFSSLGSACVLSKPLIDIRGDIHFCDKINDKFSFGNVLEGIQFEKIKKIISDYLNINENFCRKCDYQFLCRRCYIHFAQKGVLNFSKEFCEKQKKIISSQLYDYILYKESEFAHNNEIKEDRPSTRYKFHQFIQIERGPVNSAIIDLLTGEVFRIENSILEKFENSDQAGLDKLIGLLTAENLVIKTDNNTWIPKSDKQNITFEIDKFINGKYFELEIEEGVHFDLIKEQFDINSLVRITYYGTKKINKFFPSTPILYKKKSFNACISLLKKVGNKIDKIKEDDYFFNKRRNSCWGKKIAVTKDNKIRPCVYSNIVLGELKNKAPLQSILERAWKYWKINKDHVDKCKDCEVKYVCFDCREIAQRESNGNLYATNPYCQYDPYQGR
jgi:uncharacterized protein